MPPFATQKGGAWYEGTADAVTQNIDYIEQNDSEYVLILSGDQLYRMDYGEMLACHKEHNADLTIANLDGERRFDVVCYVNGMPLAFIELKKTGANTSPFTEVFGEQYIKKSRAN